ncbi:tudor domain-containing protein 10 isoform X2 [Hemicordylus capensis]|uniref:tudor domain-containing protein 10 isoform X2 n=1 Tax=Hemicordylus capensis TaxID=884348 RepID=UPI0023028E20|nr:tudor domain-containing protein 10 isoform X2 [Hemicordylus capensis]XP_053133320.1 tudor domain-containing protein 10 isoform X3 [Hemicordylus capensis]XP_053133322.1 tudor domain-containing protein 10 isoform X2 [Hemicordylus capensis]XP_053133324.1 tudor domain-containing protein 10 isoform X2 [Hemicordylus capensis]
MSRHTTEWSNSKTRKKLVKANPPRHPGPFMKEESKVYVGNLPPDIKEEEIARLFKDFGLKSVKKFQGSASKSFAVVDLATPEAVQLAIHQLNGNAVNKRQILVSVWEDRRRPLKSSSMEMPELEPVPFEELGLKHALAPKFRPQTPPPLQPTVQYAVPLEMRSSFLLHMLKDCFQDVAWLNTVPQVHGEVGLLVTDALPQTPYFWAIHLTEEHHQSMLKLFTALAKVESQVPFLAKQDVQRGTRCMAECILGNEGGAWNRCWVLEKFEDQAVVFFVDYGRSATVPLNSLRKLDSNEFWKIHPLAQPFVLQEECFLPQVAIRQVLEGRVAGLSQMEQWISSGGVNVEGGVQSAKEQGMKDAAPRSGRV